MFSYLLRRHLNAIAFTISSKRQVIFNIIWYKAVTNWHLGLQRGRSIWGRWNGTTALLSVDFEPFLSLAMHFSSWKCPPPPARSTILNSKQQPSLRLLEKKKKHETSWTHNMATVVIKNRMTWREKRTGFRNSILNCSLPSWEIMHYPFKCANYICPCLEQQMALQQTECFPQGLM